MALSRSLRSYFIGISLTFPAIGCTSMQSSPLPSGLHEVSFEQDGSKDLVELQVLTKNANIIGLGEPASPSESFYAAKIQILKTLITEGGVRRLGIEDSAISLESVDNYLQSGKATAKEVVKLMKPKFQSENFVEFITWLHEYNQKSPKNTVHVFGFEPGSFAQMDELLSQLKIDVAPQNLLDLKSCLNQLKSSSNLSETDCLSCLAVSDAYELLPEPYLTREKTAYEGSLKQVCSKTDLAKMQNEADTLAKLVVFDAKESGNPKTALWTSNRNVAKKGDTQAPLFGQMLQQQFQKQYVAIQLLTQSQDTVNKAASTSATMSPEEWLSGFHRKALYLQLDRLDRTVKESNTRLPDSSYVDAIFFLSNSSLAKEY